MLSADYLKINIPSRKTIRWDYLRLWQCLINSLSALNEYSKEEIVRKIFYISDEEFCQLIGISYNELITNTKMDTLFPNEEP
jgi:hypothetical protein